MALTPDEAMALLETYLKEAAPSYKDGDARLILQAILDDAALKASTWVSSRIADQVRDEVDRRPPR